MSRRNWKRVRPTSLRHAMELCKDYALERNNLSVDRIAERMGLADKWVIYKWMDSGRIPAVLIPAFEVACGVDFVTRWLASRDGKLLIEMPTGRNLGAEDVNNLQEVLHAAVGALIDFYGNKKKADETLADITTALESLAWHKGNVAQHDHPQLELGD